MTGTEQLKQWIEASDNIVFFGGAGVSTESGIPDFRSVDGLYHQKYDYPPETILSHTFYMEKTEEFYKFYRDKMLALDAKPNAAHLKLAELEAKGKLKAVVCIRRQAAKMYWNCTEAYIETIAENVEDCTTLLILRNQREFQNVPAVVRSSRMLCCMRKVWTMLPCSQQSILSVRQRS